MLKRGYSSIIRRGVFDIGSGSIKFQMAEVDQRSNTIVKDIFAANQQVLFLKDLRKNDYVLSEEIRAEGQAFLQAQVESAQKMGVDQFYGIAT